jgi:hypothetical protein
MMIANLALWTDEVVAHWRLRFEELGAPLPPVRVTMGFPSTGRRSKRVGECWAAEAAKDGIRNIYIKPTLDNTDSAVIVGVMVHELCHAALTVGGHGKAFKQLATRIGLTGPMRSTTVGPELAAEIAALLATVGPIPHGALDPALSGRRVQSTRMIKCQCEVCGYTARTTRQWIHTVGAPFCGSGTHGQMSWIETRNPELIP